MTSYLAGIPQCPNCGGELAATDYGKGGLCAACRPAPAWLALVPQLAANLNAPEAQALHPEAWTDMHQACVAQLVQAGADTQEAADALNEAYWALEDQ